MLTPRRKHQLGGDAVVPKKRVYRETAEQKKVVAEIRSWGGDWLVERVENENVSAAKVANARAMGMTPGSPDLLVSYKDYPPFRLEMKQEKGRVSDVQKDLHVQLRARGQIVLIGYGYDDAIKQLKLCASYLDMDHGCQELRELWQSRFTLLCSLLSLSPKP